MEYTSQYPDQIKNEMILNSALRDRTVFLNDEIDSENIFKNMYLINRIVAIDEKKALKKDEKIIKLIICSGGGSVIDGLNLLSLLSSLKRDKGYIIEIQAKGLCASMAFVLLVGGASKGYRYANEYCQLMTHDISQFKYGNYRLQDEIEDIEFSKKLSNLTMKIISDNTNLTMEQLKNNAERKKDWWIDSEEALKLGIIDKIL